MKKCTRCNKELKTKQHEYMIYAHAHCRSCIVALIAEQFKISTTQASTWVKTVKEKREVTTI